MDTIIGRLTRSEIINKIIQDELIVPPTQSMKTDFIIGFNKNNMPYREQPNEFSTQVAKRYFAVEMQVPCVDDLYVPVSHRIGRNQLHPAPYWSSCLCPHSSVSHVTYLTGATCTQGTKTVRATMLQKRETK